MCDEFIPFRADMLRAVTAGEKTMTTRNRKYGEVGHVLYASRSSEGTGSGVCIVLTAVERMPLCLVAERYHHQEGFATADAFRAAWAQIHPGAGWNPEHRVWVHTFRLEAPNA